MYDLLVDWTSSYLPFDVVEDQVVEVHESEKHRFALSSFLNKESYKMKEEEGPNSRIGILERVAKCFLKKKSLTTEKENSFLLGIMKIVAHLKDKDGDPVVSLTDPVTRKYLASFLYFCGRFEINSSEAPVHKSATAVVTYALDHLLYNRVYEDISKKYTCKDGLTRAAFLEAYLMLSNRPGEDHIKVR